MKKYIDADKLYEAVKKMKDARDRRTCSKANIYQSQVLGMVLAMIRKLQDEEE